MVLLQPGRVIGMDASSDPLQDLAAGCGLRLGCAATQALRALGSIPRLISSRSRGEAGLRPRWCGVEFDPVRAMRPHA